MNNNFYTNNKYNSVFSPNRQLINKNDFTNTGNLIHNNVNDNIQTQNVVEYQINIDSDNRNKEIYPNPFKFTIGFGDKSTINNSYLEPNLPFRMNNVKYVAINYIMLPRIIKINKINNKFEFVDASFSKYNLSSNGYLIVKIKELRNQYIQGSNPLISNDSFIIFPDKLMGNNYVMWISANATIKFKDIDLAQIDKLSIEILTPTGEQIFFLDPHDKKLDIRNIINKNKDDPAIRSIIDHMKCFISMRIGLIENDINTIKTFGYK